MKVPNPPAVGRRIQSNLKDVTVRCSLKEDVNRPLPQLYIKFDKMIMTQSANNHNDAIGAKQIKLSRRYIIQDYATT